MDMMETYFLEIDRNIERLEKATRLVWGHTPTGGNCDSYTMDIDGDTFYMVTHQATAPITAEEWAEITLTFCTGDDDPAPVDGVGTFAELVDYFIDGNPHSESAPYCEPCEECGAEMTSTGDGWIHEVTATSAECFTAHLWSK